MSGTAAQTASASADGDAGDSASDDGGSFDLGGGATSGGEPGSGCQKVDFLFVIDNSGSMGDDQQNLANSFPGFIQTIQQTLSAQDYHVMVADTDSDGVTVSNLQCLNAGCTCEPDPACCFSVCHDPALAPPRCNDAPCSIFDAPSCDEVLGGSIIEDAAGNDCGVIGGVRYMTAAQPDLGGTFSCAALRGDQGNNTERPMESMMRAVADLGGAGQCNEGFLRDDAILVVTFITDEEDDGKSMGDPAMWKQTLVDAKGGDETAVVVLGLIGDGDIAGGICPPYDPVTGDGAQPAPVLRSFIDSFGPRGFAGSVCAADYAPFLGDAVAIIDTTCDEFVPPA